MKIKSTLALLAAMFYASTALAMPITGDISWEGNYTKTGTVISTTDVEIRSATGDFAVAGFSHNDSITTADIDFGSFNPTVLWIENGFTFTLHSIQLIVDHPMITAFLGSASVTGNGFDETPYSLVFSTSFTNFSASAVPEPATGLLLLSGLIAAGALRRRTAKPVQVAA